MNLFIITGTTRGLGESLARLAASDGTNRIATVSRAPAAEIRGGRNFHADLADPAELQRACGEISAWIEGQAHARAVLINNAGVVTPVGPLDQVEPEALVRSLAVNLAGPMLLMRWFLQATGGVPLRRIINISSGAGRRPVFGWSAYCSAKAGLDMASRVLAMECATRGLAVDVVSLAPGVIDTPMQETVRAADAARFVDVERFRALKSEGMLRAADDVAADILRLEAAGKLQGEALQDLRALA